MPPRSTRSGAHRNSTITAECLLAKEPDRRLPVDPWDSEDGLEEKAARRSGPFNASGRR